MKTSELTDIALDWAVAKAIGEYKPTAVPRYSTDWSQGGPIIEREWLDLTPWPNESDEELRWHCQQHDSGGDCAQYGPTSLIAAMRCYVASKLGDTIDIPTELGGTEMKAIDLEDDEYYPSSVLAVHAAQLMESEGGSFAGHIARAFYVADTTNRERLLTAFDDLFRKFYRQYRIEQLTKGESK